MTRIRGKTAATWGKRSEWWDGTSRVDELYAQCERMLSYATTREPVYQDDGWDAWAERMMGGVSSSSEGEQGRQAEAEGGSSRDREQGSGE